MSFTQCLAEGSETTERVLNLPANTSLESISLANIKLGGGDPEQLEAHTFGFCRDKAPRVPAETLLSNSKSPCLLLRATAKQCLLFACGSLLTCHGLTSSMREN